MLFASLTVNAADDAFKCENVGADQTGFHVILEEPIGGPGANYCFRVCPKVDPKASKVKPVTVCKIKTACDGDTKDFPNGFTCQRIQIIKAESGTDLLNQYIRMIYLWAAGTIGIVAVFTMVYSGLGIMTAGGDSGKIDTYKSRIMQSLVGLVVLFLSGLILYTINPTFFV